MPPKSKKSTRRTKSTACAASTNASKASRSTNRLRSAEFLERERRKASSERNKRGWDTKRAMKALEAQKAAGTQAMATKQEELPTNDDTVFRGEGGSPVADNVVFNRPGSPGSPASDYDEDDVYRKETFVPWPTYPHSSTLSAMFEPTPPGSDLHLPPSASCSSNAQSNKNTEASSKTEAQPNLSDAMRVVIVEWPSCHMGTLGMPEDRFGDDYVVL